MRSLSLVQRAPAATVDAVRSFSRVNAAKAAIWGLLSLLLVSGVAVTSTGPGNPAPATAATSAAASTPGGSSLGGGKDLLAIASQPGESGSPVARAGAESLPAFKWTGIALEQDESIDIGFVVTVPLVLASVILTLANAVWMLLLWIMRFALGADALLEVAAGPINVGIGTVGGVAIYLMIPLMAYVVWKAIKAMVSPGRGPNGFVILAKGVLVGAVLLVIVQSSVTAAKGYDPQVLAALEQTVNNCQAEAAGDTGEQTSQEAYQNCIDTAQVKIGDTTWNFNAASAKLSRQVDAVGTVPWIADTVAGAANNVTSRVAIFSSGFAETATASNQPISPNCVDYIRQMHQDYTDGGGDPTLSVVSTLWESTLYRSWMAMSFGEPRGEYDLPSMTMCRYAERVNGTSAEDQAAIQRRATPEIDIKGPVFRPPPGPWEDRKRNENLATIAWAACTYDNGWTVSPAFDEVGTAGGETGFQEDLAKDCDQAFTTALPKDGLVDSAIETGASALWCYATALPLGPQTQCGNVGPTDVPLSQLYTQSDGLLNSTDPAIDDQIMPARVWMDNYKGLSGGGKLLHSFLALGVAIAMLFTMGGISIGLFLAQFMLIVMLMLVPVTLVMWLLGLDRKAQQMARITFTLMVSQVFFLAILTAIIILSRVFQQISGVLLGPVPGADIIRSILLGASPIIAFFIVKKVAHMLGLGNIMKFSGAASFVAGSALLASGDREAQNFASGKWSPDGRSGFQKKLTGSGTRRERAMDKIGADKVLGGTAKWIGGKAKNKGRDYFTEEGRERRKNKKAQRPTNANLAREAARLQQNSGGWRGATLGRVAELAAMASMLWEGGGKNRKAVADTAGASVGGPSSARKRTPNDADFAPSTEESPLNPAVGDALPNIGDQPFISEEESSQIIRSVKRRLEGQKKAEEGAGWLTKRESVEQEFLNETLDAHAAVLTGGADPELVTVLDAGRYRRAVAQKLGVADEDLLVGYSGLTGTRWVENRDDLRRMSLDALSDVGAWLPEEYGARLDGETTDAYLARRRAIEIEAGYATPDGRRVDAFSLMGLDITSSVDVERIERWRAGELDELLDNFIVDLNKANTADIHRAMQRAVKWSDQKLADVAHNRKEMTQELVVTLDESRAAVPFHNARLDTAGADLDKVLDGHKGVVELKSQGQASDEDIWKSWHQLQAARERFAEAAADCSATRQSILIASAIAGEDLEELLEAAASGLAATSEELEAIDAALSSAIFDAGAIDKVKDLAAAAAVREQVSLRATSENVERLVAERVNAMEILDLGSSMRAGSGVGRLKSARHLVEGLDAPYVPN